MSGTRSFRAAAAQRLSEDGGALSPAVEELLSDTRRMAIRNLPVDLVDLQPVRQDAIPEPDVLDSLVASIRQLGVLEPILVRPTHGGRYELIIGERRLRAARALGIQAIPSVVRDLDDVQARALAAESPRPAPTRDVRDAGGPDSHAGPGHRPAIADYAAADGPVDDASAPGSQRQGRTADGNSTSRTVSGRREPRVISGPGIPGPVPSDRADEEPPMREGRGAPRDDGRRRLRFGLSALPFLRRGRGNGPGEHR